MDSVSGILKNVATTALSTAVGSVVSRALQPKAKASQPQYVLPGPTPTPTAVEPPTVESEPVPAMPVPDDAGVTAQKRKQASRAASRRSGRQSTILTAADDVRLGG